MASGKLSFTASARASSDLVSSALALPMPIPQIYKIFRKIENGDKDDDDDDDNDDDDDGDDDDDDDGNGKDS